MKSIVHIPERVIERVLAKVIIDSNGCHVSTYSVGSHGYAQIGWHDSSGERQMTLCHRVAWIAEYGPVPEGYTVDHDHAVCKTRKCVSVAHLRLLTNFENARRTLGRDWPLGQCINGHPNSLLVTESSGRQRCSECKRVDQARYRAKRRALSV